ncbi:CRTAC1 family protein [Rhabdothermincola sediminis]|uniref:CRTAC1 family protein n=1 Tax=Rhabdothermincola sediminis TaxID=2751370 RepID=UPI001AA096A0|nr:CRTAC1 family protein [Rhabdothermincola sediminis]
MSLLVPSADHARRVAAVVLALAALLAAACSGAGEGLDAEATGGSSGSPIRFTEVAERVGITHVQQPLAFTPDTCLYPAPPEVGYGNCVEERMSGGVAAGDYDGDGDVDLYFTRLRSAGVLYRNDGTGQFTDVSAEAGLDRQPLNGNGAAWADIDNDGWVDLYVTTLAEERFYLFHNNGDGTFTEQALERGAALADEAPRGGTSVAVGDFDNDGWVDLHICEWLNSFRMPSGPSTHARLLRNLGPGNPGHFEDVTERAGVGLGQPGVIRPLSLIPPRLQGQWLTLAFGSTFVDLDGDGWQDLAVASDFRTSQLFWNNGDGTFTEGTQAAAVATEGNAMGSTFGDIDGDGDLDWFVTAIQEHDQGSPDRPAMPVEGYDGNRLYRNDGNRHFTDVTDEYGVRDGAWGWGAAFADFDDDGLLDLVMENGMDLGYYDQLNKEEFRQTPMRLWRGSRELPWAEIAAQAGLVTLAEGKGLAVADLDGDGDLDVVVANTGARPSILRNESPGAGRAVRIDVSGTTSARDAPGAVVTVTLPGGATQTYQVGVGTHFLGQSEHTVHAGIGDVQAVDVSVRWPVTGRTLTLTGVAVGSRVRAVEPPA